MNKKGGISLTSCGVGFTTLGIALLFVVAGAPSLSNGESRLELSAADRRWGTWVWQAYRDYCFDRDPKGGVLQSVVSYLRDPFKQASLVVTCSPGKDAKFSVGWTEGGRATANFDLRANQSFVRYLDKVIISECWVDTPGCAVSAYDVASGRKLWRTETHNETPLAASGYYNNVVLTTLSPASMPKGIKSDGVVLVIGSESYCDYIEILDASNGESLALRHFRVGFSVEGGEGIDEDGIPLPRKLGGRPAEPAEVDDQRNSTPAPSDP